MSSQQSIFSQRHMLTLSLTLCNVPLCIYCSLQKYHPIHPGLFALHKFPCVYTRLCVRRVASLIILKTISLSTAIASVQGMTFWENLYQEIIIAPNYTLKMRNSVSSEYDSWSFLYRSPLPEKQRKNMHDSAT